MRRMLLMAVMGSALALAVPGVASAHHGKRHHARHHKHAHLVKFGTASVSTTPSGPTATTPTGTPAGKVKSFENGVLVITLADESTVSGKVTDATRLRCRSAASQENSGDDDQGGDEHGDVSAHVSDHNGSQGWHHVDDGDDDDNGNPTACTTAALVPGAVVGEAELNVSSAGAVWEKVELIQ
jgi:hypothetical protein